ncbi:hypothetical protein DFP93_102164 [Aneurinibacillus soli]|uniref:Uncharacterized protein n=1 Tax=Aneurinibacillus soli TaxID=1500254 RepID=A0A0U5C6D7_9BACL|nr:hypothetical protein [Aneurinibacillus soli]PYE63480.1 hypothetical protein DFP93_102164 [Aneurinibacillus soli]BAU27587.1 hypothetical protein CB4_01761 [Aneurinibacillus soli]
MSDSITNSASNQADPEQDYIHFKANILDKEGELTYISNELTRISNSKQFLPGWYFFRDHFLNKHYGSHATNFLINILDGQLPNLNHLLAPNKQAELGLFAHKHRAFLSRTTTASRNPFSLAYIDTSWSDYENLVLNFLRADGESLELHFDLDQKIRFILFMLNQIPGDLVRYNKHLDSQYFEDLQKISKSLSERVSTDE